MVEVNPYLEDVNTVWKKHCGLLHTICKKYRKAVTNNSKLDYDDIFSVASLGFVKAYQKFNPSKFEKPQKFSSYLWTTADGEIKRFFRDHSHDLHVSRRIKEVLVKINKSEVANWEPEILSESLNIPVRDIEDALNYRVQGKTMSLHKVMFEDEGSANGEVTLIETVTDENDYFPKYTDIEQDESIVDIMYKMYEVLNEREFTIFRESTLFEKSQVEIGKSLGISQMQVSRTLRTARNKLKEYFKNTEYGEGKKTMPKKISSEVLKAIDLIKTTEKNYAEIAEITGAAYPTVAYHGKKIGGLVDPSKSTKKNNPNGPVMVRKMTDEEKVKYGLSPKKEVEKQTEETIEVQETVPEPEKSSQISTNIHLSFENVELGDIETQIRNAIQALRLLGVKSVKLSVESRQ